MSTGSVAPQGLAVQLIDITFGSDQVWPSSPQPRSQPVVASMFAATVSRLGQPLRQSSLGTRGSETSSA